MTAQSKLDKALEKLDGFEGVEVIQTVSLTERFGIQPNPDAGWRKTARNMQIGVAKQAITPLSTDEEAMADMAASYDLFAYGPQLDAANAVIELMKAELAKKDKKIAEVEKARDGFKPFKADYETTFAALSLARTGNAALIRLVDSDGAIKNMVRNQVTLMSKQKDELEALQALKVAGLADAAIVLTAFE